MSNETSLTRHIKFYLFSIPLVPSLLCSIYLMICFVRQPNLRHFPNHVMICIIIIEFADLTLDLIPLALPYFYTGYIYSVSLCGYWSVGNYGLQAIASWLMAWASIDRYFLIFSYYRRHTYIRYDVPIVVIFLFVIVWYIILVLLHPCTDNWYDINQFLCSGPCFNDQPLIASLDWVVVVLLPTLVIVVFNILLLARVLIQKYRQKTTMNQRSFTWRKNRKLLIQLLGIIFAYLITQFPLAIFSVVRLLGPSDFLIEICLLWLFYTPYLIYIITPFTYLGTTKECRINIWKRQHRITAVPLPSILQNKTFPKSNSNK